MTESMARTGPAATAPPLHSQRSQQHQQHQDQRKRAGSNLIIAVPTPALTHTPVHPAVPPSAFPQSGSPVHQQQDADPQPPPPIVTFSPVSPGLHTSQLGPQYHQQYQRSPSTSSTSSTRSTNTATAPAPAPALDTAPTPTPQPAVPPLKITTTPASDSSSSTSAPLVKASAHQPRKPSPGLAARLKALGFGPSAPNKPDDPPASPSAAHDRVGRLPEDHLRQLDEKHLANTTASVIERRGRPWKGAGAPLHLLRSKSSRDAVASPASKAPDLNAPSTQSQDPSHVLPEITEAAPLDMDASKFRLPDHTNGNGTKAHLDVRNDHITRDSQSSSTADTDSPPPPPPPKDTPPEGTASTEFNPGLPSYFNPLGLQRPGSIYTISRASFANQLAQLTALQLPDAELLSNKVAAIPTAEAAAKALIGAADQIRSWISKASEVIGGLDSDDDVEWAAAGGREGYEEVENAITRFEELINVYVSAIEELQSRPDIGSVSNEDLQNAVTQMEAIMGEWQSIRTTLKNAKTQVETAMEWEELWNMVLGDIQNEMDELSRLVFEMEERRHKSAAVTSVEKGDGVDLGDLETIVEDAPPSLSRNKRVSLPAFPNSPSSPGTPQLSRDDSSLLALFARMQPLRASLDFLPMRLSAFENRAQGAFPTACEELEMRQEGLEGSYKKLEKDAESLRKELGEDKWILVFRGAGRQALKMIESVDRSMLKLREAIDQDNHISNPPGISKKVDSYEAKRTHYGPAIERVLSIVERGVKDRLTVNGEILRLHTDMQSRWAEVRNNMKETDSIVEEILAENPSQQLRDSISSMVSNDRSTVASGRDTPGSSPPSSVVMSSLGIDPVTPVSSKKSRAGSNTSHLPQSNSRRTSLAPPSHSASRRPLGSRISTLSSSPGGSSPSRGSTATPQGRRPSSTTPNSRPRWNGSTNTNDSDTGHNFKPMSLTTPSPYQNSSASPRSGSSLGPASRESKLPIRSPLSREATSSPMQEGTPTRKSTSRLGFRDRISSPGPSSHNMMNKLRSSAQSSTSALGERRSSQPKSQPAANTLRPSSSLASGRRSSLLPRSTGRDSPQAVAGARSAMSSALRKSSGTANKETKDSKPRWHF